MTVELRYLSWLRRGLARSLNEEADTDGVPTGAIATLDVTVEADGASITRSVGVRGPGAVIGLAPGEVLRTDPVDGADDHPLSRFPSVELRTPDLPWLFTPARPKADRLIPWLALVVVESRPGVVLGPGTVLPVLTVDVAARELPRLREAWAWAHVQVNATGRVDDLLETAPETLTARLLCPRVLAPATAYIACVVPTFEAGRLSGLGVEPIADASELAWGDDSAEVQLPVLHSWRFATSADGADFEELVRRLDPIPLQPGVGVHALDLTDPGTARLPSVAAGTSFVGALVSPDAEPAPWPPKVATPYAAALGALLAAATPGEPPAKGQPYVARLHDPTLGPPAYGALPAGVDEVAVPSARTSVVTPVWISDVNLDPAHRAGAGLGAEVVRRNQETLMAAAWDQARGLVRVNALLGRTRLACEVGVRAQPRLTAMSDGALLQLTAGAHTRLHGDVAGATVRGRLATGVPSGSVSAAFRRLTRPGGVVARAGAHSMPGALTTRITARLVDDRVAMLGYAQLTVPFGAVTSNDADMELQPVDRDVVVAPETAVRVEAAIAHAATEAALRTAARVRSAGSTPTTTPTRRERQTTGAPITPVRTIDSAFGPLDHVLSGLGLGTIVPSGSVALQLAPLADVIRTQFEPTVALSARLRAVIAPASVLGSAPVPAWIGAGLSLVQPLSRKLVQIDPEYLMPGVGELDPESIGLAEVNQRFIEAFLLAANDELRRELIWREYPTDLSGTWLRTFWDAVGATGPDGSPLVDIPPVADWKHTKLGSHPGTMDPELVLVLVVKGALLRRYPQTLVTAVPAHWVQQRGAWLREEDPKGTALPPIFSGSLGSDVLFLGFQFPAGVEIDADVAGSSDQADGRPGWYFAFEQPPTTPGFGLDTPATDESPDLRLWRDATWDDARTSPDQTHVSLTSLEGTTLPYDDIGVNTWDETWGTTSAAMARITLQRPVRMLVHADQLLTADDAS